jgi:hypothetical protein
LLYPPKRSGSASVSETGSRSILLLRVACNCRTLVLYRTRWSCPPMDWRLSFHHFSQLCHLVSYSQRHHQH